VAFCQYEAEGESDSATALAYGGHLGVKAFMSEDAAFNVEGDVTMYEPEFEGENDPAPTPTTR